MRVLYVSSGGGEDYQRDVLFHGLRELLGSDAVDVGRIDSLYRQPDEAKHALYGRGYTVYATLPAIDVDRTDIEDRIRSGYFNLIVFGSIHRCTDYLNLVLRSYPPNRVAFVDGEDESRVKWPLLGKGVYFKRELPQPLMPFLQPIHFAVPAEKFLDDRTFEEQLLHKTRKFAPCDPRDRSTYVFNTEHAYYRQYQEAYFGITMKKAGWDCMRHHEIVACGAAPYFLGLEDCPPWTLHKLPRSLLTELRDLADGEGEAVRTDSHGRYAELVRRLFDHYKRNFTTRALAEYFLQAMADSAEVENLRTNAWLLQSRRLMNSCRSKAAMRRS